MIVKTQAKKTPAAIGSRSPVARPEPGKSPPNSAPLVRSEPGKTLRISAPLARGPSWLPESAGQEARELETQRHYARLPGHLPGPALCPSPSSRPRPRSTSPDGLSPAICQGHGSTACRGGSVVSCALANAGARDEELMSRFQRGLRTPVDGCWKNALKTATSCHNSAGQA
jgi:hypothetical protein